MSHSHPPTEPNQDLELQPNERIIFRNQIKSNLADACSDGLREQGFETIDGSYRDASRRLNNREIRTNERCYYYLQTQSPGGDMVSVKITTRDMVSSMYDREGWNVRNSIRDFYERQGRNRAPIQYPIRLEDPNGRGFLFVGGRSGTWQRQG